MNLTVEYDDLVRHHLINLLDRGTYENRSAMILTGIGNTLSRQLLDRYDKGGTFNWPTIRKIIRHTVWHLSEKFCSNFSLNFIEFIEVY